MKQSEPLIQGSKQRRFNNIIAVVRSFEVNYQTIFGKFKLMRAIHRRRCSARHFMLESWTSGRWFLQIQIACDIWSAYEVSIKSLQYNLLYLAIFCLAAWLTENSTASKSKTMFTPCTSPKSYTKNSTFVHQIVSRFAVRLMNLICLSKNDPECAQGVQTIADGQPFVVDKLVYVRLFKFIASGACVNVFQDHFHACRW